MEWAESERAAWAAALTLPERGSGGRAAGLFDPGRARRRLDRWRALPGFEEDGLFERRLAADGLTAESVLPLLGESPEELAARLPEEPGWLREISAAYSAPPAEEPLPWPVRAPDDRTELLALADPLARAALARLADSVRDQEERARDLGERARDQEERARDLGAGASGADPRHLAGLFLGSLGDRLRVLLVRALVVELQVARLEGGLEGDTPAERYRSFVDRLRDPAVAVELLSRYPVLARDVVRRVRQWETASLELLRRLAADRGAIAERFAGGSDPGALVEVRGGLGDSHRDGRSVAILRFVSGLQLVYKPRSMSVDRAFQRLLAWLNERGFEPAYRTLAVLDRGSYGWVEHAAAGPCATAAEVERFYRRQGGYLALLYLLEGTDFHLENLVAAGEHPVLVDLETLFHPQVYVDDPLRRTGGRGFHDSVLRIGLLPQRVWGDGEHRGVDLGGLGSADDQLTRPFWTPVDGGTDAMRFEKRPQRIDATSNRPRLDGPGGGAVDARHHVESIEAGFRDLYRLLAAHRRELARPDGPLGAFAEAEVRVVLRPTASYGALLMESGHPHAAGDALERTRLLDRLWGGALSRPWLEPLVPHEIAALERGDVPRFTARPDARDLWTDTGERIAGVFAQSGLERARERLSALSERDLERQAWLVRAALGILTLESGEGDRPATRIAEAEEEAAASDLVGAAREIGERLDDLAFREGDDVRWLSSQALGPGHWALLDAPADLYLGTPGIALFLAHLGRLAGDGGATALAAAALATARRRLGEIPSGELAVGAFNGWGGLIHVFTHLGLLWREPELLAEAESLVPRVRDGLAADEHHDLLAGAAGGLLALLGLHRARPSEATRAAAVACGEHLLAHAVPMGRGAAWVMAAAGPRPLAGLSHGAAGIALALLHLARETGDGRFRRAALDGLAYERSLYDPERRNWPDLRQGAAELSQLHGEGDEHFMCAWCHGAAGVGLARVASLPLLDGAERAAAREEIRAAVATTLAEGLRGNHSLCHGALGNLDFLLQAARVLGDAELAARVRRLAGGVLRSVERDGWLHGLPRGAAPLGLMVGLAGIGLGLLRLAAPEEVPSLLTLELPASEETAAGRVARAAPAAPDPGAASNPMERSLRWRRAGSSVRGATPSTTRA